METLPAEWEEDCCPSLLLGVFVKTKKTKKKQSRSDRTRRDVDIKTSETEHKNQKFMNNTILVQ